jgi:hypothetical protein
LAARKGWTLHDLFPWATLEFAVIPITGLIAQWVIAIRQKRAVPADQPSTSRRFSGARSVWLVLPALGLLLIYAGVYLNGRRSSVAARSWATDTVVIQGIATTTVHVQRGADVLRVPRIDTQLAGYTRTVTFDPPLPVGGLALADGKAEPETIVGDFRGAAHIQSDDRAFDLRQEGVYTATVTIRSVFDAGADIRQWAVDAKASSEHPSGDWAASEAAGPLNSFRKDRIHTAWVPDLGNGEPESIELTYARAVTPTSVDVWKMDAATRVTRLQAYDVAAQRWAILWEETPESDQAGESFSPPLTGARFATDRLRVTISTEGLHPGFDLNGIKAVALVGRPESDPWVNRIEGEWLESGTSEICSADDCQVTAWTCQPPRQWTMYVNGATGAVGTTPESVR